MWNRAFALAALLCAISVSFADSSGALAARMKTDALDFAVKPFLHEGEIATYDNFIAKTGTEYVVVSISLAPSFLAALSYENGVYRVDFIRDNSTIRQIMEGRLAVFNLPGAKVDAKEELHPLFAEFWNARFLQEEKCRLVIGIGSEGCVGEEACAAACQKSPVCSKYFEGKHVSAAEIAEFSKQGREMDALLYKEKVLSENGAAQDVDYAKKYMGIVDGVEKTASAISSLALANDGVVCQQIKYDLSPIGKAREKVSAMQDAASMAAEKNNAIEGVQKTTAGRLPKEEKTVVVSEEDLAKSAVEEKLAQEAPAKENAPAPQTKNENVAPSQNAMVGETGSWLLDLGRGAMIAVVGGLAVASGYFYYRKRKGQLGKGLRI